MRIYQTDYALYISERGTQLEVAPLDGSLEIELDDDREKVNIYLDFEAVTALRDYLSQYIEQKGEKK